MRTRYAKGGTTIGIGEIDNLPGCSQVAVFHSAFVLPEYRNKGEGFQAHVERLETAIRLGYDYAICTVQQGNTAQEKILHDNGWEEIGLFFSRKTGHYVTIYGINL